MMDAINTTQIAMQMDQLQLQTITQNIANINTPGFKRQQVILQDFDEHLLPFANQVIAHRQELQIKTQGAFSRTDKPADLALGGEGYFRVQGEEGIFYTRRGDFQVNNQGELVTATGEHLLGKSGIIKVDDHPFTIKADGSILLDHHRVDQLDLVQFEQPDSLEYLGNGLYRSEETPVPIAGGTTVMQGFIEQSNVKSIDEMMEMLTTSRHFEASQRIMRTADSLLATAINQLGESNV